MKISNLFAIAGLVAAATSAQAVTIPGLVNTGVGASLSVDNNYKFGGVGTATGTPCTVGGGNCGVATVDGSFPLDTWLSNGSSPVSKWLTPSANQAQSYDTATNGVYTWTLTFNLAGFDPSTASLAGRFLADNSATVQLNSGSVLATANSFTAWTTFSAATGFVTGMNTLTFTATNLAQSVGSNPTGIRVEFTNSSVSAVPEPSAMLLSLAGLAMVGGLAKRRLANRA